MALNLQHQTAAEFAATPEELVAKNFAIAGAVVAAVTGACAELAAPFTQKGKK